MITKIETIALIIAPIIGGRTVIWSQSQNTNQQTQARITIVKSIDIEFNVYLIIVLLQCIPILL